MKTIIAILIYLVILLAGIFGYIRIRVKMKDENIEMPPVIRLFFIFLSYGGMIMLIVTSFLVHWSGMASLGLFYLIFVAPVITGFIAFLNKNDKEKSKYHNLAFILAIAYIPLLAVYLIIIASFG